MRIVILVEEPPPPGRELLVDLEVVPRTGEEVVLGDKSRLAVVRVEHLTAAARRGHAAAVRLICRTAPAVVPFIGPFGDHKVIARNG
jgi:hypothetical protein